MAPRGSGGCSNIKNKGNKAVSIYYYFVLFSFSTATTLSCYFSVLVTILLMYVIPLMYVILWHYCIFIIFHCVT